MSLPCAPPFGSLLTVMNRLTQKEIARRLGVSQALVSRALTGTSAQIDASPVTVARIRRAAADWNYRPSAAALTLKGRSTRTLGVVIKAFDDPFLGHLIGELQGLARRQSYTLLLAGWDEHDQDEAGVELLERYRPDGLLIAGSDCRPAAVDAFLSEGRPVVQIGSGPAASGVTQVLLDEAAGLRALAAYLAGLGHRIVAYVGGESPAQLRRERRLRDALSAAGLEVAAGSHVRVSGEHPQALTDAVRKLGAAGGGPRPTAVIAGDDSIAQTVLRALHDRGLRVPDDVSLAGFDDIPAARAMIPALTTVRQPVPAMVREAFSRVTRVVTDPDTRPGTNVMLVPEMVVRESCAPPRG